MIYLFLAAGFEEIEALCPLDLLRRAGLSVRTVGIGSTEITGAHGITVKADMADSDFSDKAPELVILPGGMPGTTHLDGSPTVHRAIDAALSSGGRVAAICAAPSILGKKGLLRGKRATCFPGFEETLDGAILCTDGVVTDEPFTTARGMGVAQEFGLSLVALMTDEETASALRRTIQSDR